MDLLKGGISPSSEALLPVDAREKTASGTQYDSRQRPAPTSKMACVRRAILVLLLCMLVLLGVASAGSSQMLCHKHKGATDPQAAAGTSDSSSFSDLLKSASPASLHELLHRYFPDRFRHGVWESEHKAVEAVHRVDATLATSILQLAKREDTTSSANSTTSSASSSTASTESSSTSTIDTTSSTTTSPTSSSSSAAPTSTSSVPSVTTSSSSSSTTPTSMSSSSSSETTLTTSTVPHTTTTSTSRTSKAVVETLTTTSPDGAVVTITATTFVPGDSGETAAPSSTTKAPSLQSSAISRRGGGSMLAGAVGLAVLLLVV